MSPRRLDLQILCKSGASIERILASWETLPLIVRFKGSPKTKSLPTNIPIALCHPDRVREIDLGLTNTTVGLIVDAIKQPFQTLERIRITIKDATGPSLLFRNAFLGGSSPRLRELALDGISFPFSEIKQVISTNNLVELHLSRIPKNGYFSADALVTALSTSAQLRHLHVSFHDPTFLPIQSITSPPPRRTTFPSLVFLEFHGASEYLEEFVSLVDFPSLDIITIKLFNQIIFEIPQFCRSIQLLNLFRFPTEAEITLSTKLVTIYFRQKPMTRRRPRGIKHRECSLSTVCERLDWKLYFVTQVSGQLSLLLKNVNTLIISQDNGMPSGEDVDPKQWLELFQPFTHVQTLRVAGQLVPDIALALVTEDMTAGVLPKLEKLFFAREFRTPAAEEAARQFVAMRKLSGHYIYLSF